MCTSKCRTVLFAVLIVCVMTSTAGAEPTGAPMAVRRWWQPGEADWTSVADDGNEPSVKRGLCSPQPFTPRSPSLATSFR